MWRRVVVGASAALVSMGVAAAYWLKSTPQAAAKGEATGAAAIACSLNLDELPARRERLASFWARARQIRRLEDGYAFRFGFDRSTLEEATRVISDESQCCGFFDFQLTARPSDDELVLEITGPAGAAELLAATVPAKRVDESAENPRGQAAPPSCCSEDGACTGADGVRAKIEREEAS